MGAAYQRSWFSGKVLVTCRYPLEKGILAELIRTRLAVPADALTQNNVEALGGGHRQWPQ